MRNLGHGNENSLLAVTEGCQLTVWDLRMKENGGCVNRICGSVGDTFYAVCGSSTGNIAVGGAGRTVTIYDPRRLLDLLSHLSTLITSMYKDYEAFVYLNLHNLFQHPDFPHAKPFY